MTPTFCHINPRAVEYTGFHGWLNTSTGEVIFCGRMAHLAMLEKSQLPPIDGDFVYEPASEGGPEGTSWMEIRRWAATQGWVHFVSNDDTTLLYFIASSKEQESICRAFAREAGVSAIFKGTAAYT